MSRLRLVDASQLWLPLLKPEAGDDEEDTASRLRGQWRVLRSAPPESWNLPPEDELPRRLRAHHDDLDRLLMRCAMAGVPSAVIAMHIDRSKRTVDNMYERLARPADEIVGSSRERLLGRIWQLKAEEDAARRAQVDGDTQRRRSVG